MIRTLLFSTLYPSSVRPIHGIFVETRLRELLESGAIETRVVSPVPWFPLSGARYGEYGKFAATPRYEKRNDVDVYHPRYFLPPKVGMNIAPYTLALGALPVVRRLLREGFDFDLIDAHYYYPDGVAASFIAKWLGKPFVVTARGSDVNLIPHYPYPKRLILQAAERAYASITVSKALAGALADIGADGRKLFVFRNGVDLQRFRPEDKNEARLRLGLPGGRMLLSVGNLIEIKGHHIAIEALASLPEDVFLAIVGRGPDQQKLDALIQRLGLGARVRLVGQVPNTELKWWYSAADALVLCSSREGWPNVLLESMACGTPVVATEVGGTREIVGEPVAGRIVRDRRPETLARVCRTLLEGRPASDAVRRYAEGFSWKATTDAQIGLFSEIVKQCVTSS